MYVSYKINKNTIDNRMAPVKPYFKPSTPAIMKLLHILVLLGSIVLVATFSLEILQLIPELTSATYQKIQLWICLVFMIDFFVGWYLEKNKGDYLKHNLVFLLVSIPYFSILQHAIIHMTPEMYYFLKFIPVIRGGYALIIIVKWFTYNKVTSLLITYLTILMAMVYFSSLIFFIIESPVNNMVNKFTDALWWAFMDVTTVGSNIYAMTGIGKVLSVLLAALGMMMFPIFTVYITEKVESRKKTTKPDEEEDTTTNNS